MTTAAAESLRVQDALAPEPIRGLELASWKPDYPTTLALELTPASTAALAGVIKDLKKCLVGLKGARWSSVRGGSFHIE